MLISAVANAMADRQAS